MALINCKECGKEHSDAFCSCPHCGFKRNAIKQSDQQNIKDLKGEAQYTWEHGIYLAHRTESHFVINLYSVDKFFVKVYYNPEEVRINKIRCYLEIVWKFIWMK